MEPVYVDLVMLVGSYTVRDRQAAEEENKIKLGIQKV